MIRDPGDWRSRDLAVLWHPCTQMREHPDTLPLVPIERGEGAWLQGFDGRRYLDAVSSWWTNLHGHAEPRIAAAIARQAGTLEQVMLAGFSHRPAIGLAEKLIAIAPKQAGRAPLAKVFYADNGSAGVEVALKMAFHWFRNAGETRRTKFVALQNGYHGETIGALSVGDIPLYRRVYAPLLVESLFAPSPDAYLARDGQSAAGAAEDAADALARLLDEHVGEVCALILEPRLQCAGGMRMYDPVYLQRARALCDANGAFLIADEIATGFGRTGTMFACQQADVTPDILCLSKALTGGAIGLGATVASARVFDAFLSEDHSRALMHGPTYMANPLACAAANASLDLFEREPRLEQVAAIEAHLSQALEPCRKLAGVADVRAKGAIGVVQLQEMKGLDWLRRRFVDEGLWLRPFADIVYCTPAFTISPDDLARLTDGMVRVVTEWSRKFG
jgi:adenosylmethionine-8-amino-7-oxononanoate aminotransferase